MSTPAVTIYDTTLRDGTQGEGVAFSLLDKLRIAERLDEFGMHYIEGGWPGSNPKDMGFFEEAKKRTWRHSKIAAFGSTRRANTAVENDPQIQTLLDADTPVVTFFGKSWLLHVTEVLGVTPQENRSMILDTTRFFKKAGREVIYDAEHFFDGFKDDSDHALSTLNAAKEGGADLLVLCDTNGGTLPDEVGSITRRVIEALGVPVGIHTHNDSGVGVANALAAVREGARQVQGTMNGFGERVGNCNLTSVVPTLQLKLGVALVPNLAMLRDLSLFVDELANLPHDRRAPYVGTTAFSHKGGMHVNAVQKVAHSYEHIRPEAVGNTQHILISELSGQSNILMKAKELGFDLKKGSPEVSAILGEIKRLENLGHEFESADASFKLLIKRSLKLLPNFFEFHFYHCDFARQRGGNRDITEAVVKISVDGVEEHTVAEGDGPVNALDNALRKALVPFYPAIQAVKLLDYKVRIIDGNFGTAAKTRVLITSSDGKDNWGTVGVSNNIIEASWQALTDSMVYHLQNQASPEVSK
ncbi:MAG: citramalate synthase [Verrucomicrobiales bacterium]